MAAFKFGLDPVLRQRAREEEEKQRKVAQLERQRLAIEDEIRGYQRSIEAEREDLSTRLDAAREGEAGINLGDVRVQANASLHMITMAQRSAVRLAGVYERLDEARLELLEASVRRKAVEALRDKRYEAWRQKRSKAELAALDELGVMRYGRGDVFGTGSLGGGLKGGLDDGADGKRGVVA
ncbi:MAG: flagellar FliJ family protein [Planctomycetota bacterium]